MKLLKATAFLSALLVLIVFSPKISYAAEIVTEECLVYQPYDDAGEISVTVPESVHTYITVKQISQEKEYFLFYNLDLCPETETSYIMSLETGAYEISVRTPILRNSSEYLDFSEKIIIENPDFSTVLDKTEYNYTIQITNETLNKPIVNISDDSTLTNGVKTVSKSVQFTQIEASLGDVNEDGNIDADDSSFVLAEYASISAGNQLSFSELQFKLADVNEDGLINADDSSLILSYYAYISSGGNKSLEDFYENNSYITK